MLAPMAGLTHSAFRRLAAGFGGYGALFTEMLSPSALRGEDIAGSPYTKRRPEEGRVIYQVRFSAPEEVAPALDRLAPAAPDGIDINLGCPAPEIKKTGGGVMLFADLPRLASVLQETRRRWPGLLSVKFRLGDESGPWRALLSERIRLFEDGGVDLLILHPRFIHEKLKRIARWKEFAALRAQTRLPLIANGDICRPGQLDSHAEAFAPASGIMIGRMAAVQPWIFRLFLGETPGIDHAGVWDRFYRYVLDDFPPEKAIGRIKEFTAYYARNFFFGQQLHGAVQGAKSLEQLRQRALSFLAAGPRLSAQPDVAGV